MLGVLTYGDFHWGRVIAYLLGLIYSDTHQGVLGFDITKNNREDMACVNSNLHA